MDKQAPVSISKQALQRMPYYLQALRAARDAGAEIISAPTVASQLGLNEVQVRKDFAAVSDTAPGLAAARAACPAAVAGYDGLTEELEFDKT